MICTILSLFQLKPKFMISCFEWSILLLSFGSSVKVISNTILLVLYHFILFDRLLLGFCWLDCASMYTFYVYS